MHFLFTEAARTHQALTYWNAYSIHNGSAGCYQIGAQQIYIEEAITAISEFSVADKQSV